MDNLLKMLNIVFELFIWVGLWGIFENILRRFKLSSNTKLCVYALTIVIAFVLIYLVNGSLGYKTTFYDHPTHL